MFKKTKYSITIFEKEDDKDHLYRIIKEDKIRILEKLDPKYFPEWEEVDENIKEEYNTLKIKKLPYDVRIYELTENQVYTSLLFLVDFIIHGLEQGLTIFDIHEGNILYSNGRPYFVDLNAFRMAPDGADYQFVMMAYLYLRYVKNAKLDKGHAGYNINDLKQVGGPWIGELFGIGSHKIECWEKFKKILLNGAPPKAQTSLWSDGYAIEETQKKNPKLVIAKDILKSTGGSMIDIGTNKGYFPFMVSDMYDSILGIDPDVKCIDIATARCSNDNITFACLGIEDYYSSERNLGQFKRSRRHQGDTLVALAVTHHFSELKFPIEKVANTFCDLARKWILIEDIVHVEAYHKVFRERGFECVDKRDSSPKNRKLTLWKNTKSS